MRDERRVRDSRFFDIVVPPPLRFVFVDRGLVLANSGGGVDSLLYTLTRQQLILFFFHHDGFRRKSLGQEYPQEPNLATSTEQHEKQVAAAAGDLR